MLAVIGMASRTQNFGLSSSLLQARGEMLGATPKNAASRTQALDQAFDADKIYGQGPETDLDHPNRIDEYGCMFSNCADDAGAGGMLRKVTSLKKQLHKFMTLQKALDERLSKPVHTDVTVTAGEPGRLGPRGARGPVGLKGHTGARGPTGEVGFPGRPGIPGRRGLPGFPGPAGETGSRGPPGVKGPQGPIGGRGGQGPQGSPGPRGPRGYQGDAGVEGQPGQEGNMGAKGIAPAGPQGNPGPPGDKGARGPKGPEGLRGPKGSPGPRGTSGATGLTGGQGVPGKDAKQFKPSDCGVKRAQTTERICCGRAQVHWHTFAGQASSININTRECKFEGNVRYFPNVKGNGHQWQQTSGGMTNVQNTGFTFRTTALYDNLGSNPAWYANAYQWTVSWCGIGKTSLKTTTSVCCENSPLNQFSYWYVGGVNINQDTSKCGFRGSPQYHMSISAKQETYSIGAVNDLYNGYRPWNHMFSTYPIQSPEWPWHTYHKSRSDQWRLQWCGFGETFPTGGMLVGKGDLDEPSYPCKGVRMIQDNIVKSEVGEMCCGTSNAADWENGRQIVRNRHSHEYWKSGVYKDIDTSSCGFAAEPRPVWLATLTGEHTWSTTGGNSYSRESANGFRTEVMGWKEDATTVNANKASNWKWRVQWCGFGVKK